MNVSSLVLLPIFPGFAKLTDIMIATTCREPIAHCSQLYIPSYLEGPTLLTKFKNMHPKTSLQQQRFQQYKETTGHRYIYHFLCQNPDKHTWKWKTTGRTAEKKVHLHHFTYFLCNLSLFFHHATNGIQRSAKSLLTLVGLPFTARNVRIW